MTEAPQVDRSAQLELAILSSAMSTARIMALVGRLKRNAHDAELEPLLEELHTTLGQPLRARAVPGRSYTKSMGAYGSALPRVSCGCSLARALRDSVGGARFARESPPVVERGTHVRATRGGVAGVVARLEAHEHRGAQAWRTSCCMARPVRLVRARSSNLGKAERMRRVSQQRAKEGV